MVVGLLASFVVNTGVFMGLAKVLPGFKMKDTKAAAISAVVFGILVNIAIFASVPLVIAAIAALAFIPIIGPLLAFLAGLGAIVAIPVIVFIVSVIVLIVTDKLLEDFEMDSIVTAVIASFILAIANVAVRFFLPF